MSKVYLLCLVFTILIFTQCKKDKDDEVDPIDNAIGTGKFTLAGQTYTGICVASPAPVGQTGVTVIISASTTSTEAFTIGNLSTVSSGTSVFGDGWQQPPGVPFGVLATTATSLNMATKPGGSITKTGANSFTFTCTVYDITGPGEYSITGSGTYR